MNRSTFNRAVRDAILIFCKKGWHLPLTPKRDVADISRFPEINEGELPIVKL